MSEQVPEKAPNEDSWSDAAIAAILAILVAGPPLITAVQAISAALKAPKKAVLTALAAMKYKPGKKTLPVGGVAAATKKQNLKFRAAYLIKAVNRIAAAPDLATGLAREKALFNAHLAASKKRLDAAKASEKMATSTGATVLGWGGILDDRTTADCQWLIGKNYAVSNPPDGLHPGARHRFCRCYPVPAYPGKPVVTNLPATSGDNSTV